MARPMPDITAAVAAAAEAINSPRSLSESLHTIVDVARVSIPGFDHAGISVIHGDGTIETLAGTDALVWDLDALQYEVDEGPCVDAMRRVPVVTVEHAQHAQQWPRYIPQAVACGLKAQLALRLYDDGDAVGGLNLYSTESETVDPDAQHVAQLFASHAAIALGRARVEEQLTEAMVTRQIIGQATGLLMERYQLDPDRAFQFLIRTSQTSNSKLRDVARELVDAARDRYGFTPEDT